MKITPTNILRYSLFVTMFCLILLKFVKPSVSITGPLLFVIIGAIVLAASSARRKKS